MNRILIGTLLLLLLSLLQCTVGEPRRQQAEVPRGSDFSNWNIVFQEQSRIVDFQVFHTGEVEVPVNGMLNREMDPGEAETMFVDVYAFWFCHKVRGCFMIDSGLDTSFGQGRPGNVHGLLASSYIISSRQKQGTDILSHLNKDNRKSRLQGVFFTHLHGDHSSGIPAISGDPELKNLDFYVAEGEPYINLWLLYQGDHLDRVESLLELPVRKGVEMPVLGTCLDVFGDGSFWAIHTPGHSPEHLSYLVVTDEGPVLLTGDASHTRTGFENGIEPGWVSDREQAVKSLQKLRDFSNRFPEVRVIFGHQR